MRRWWNALTPEERRAKVAARDKERVRRADRDRAKTPTRKAAAVRVTKAWRAKDPLRTAAHNAVARALRSGKLTKGPCERAGDDCNGPVHAHHDDYAKPLEVRWFCGKHHHAMHAEERQAA